MDARIIGERSDAVLRTAMPGHDAEKAVSNKKRLGFVSPKPVRAFVREISDSHFKQPARKKAKASPPLFSQGAGSAGISHPLGSRGECSLTKGEGSGAPKGAGNIQTPCGARPMT